MTFAIFTLVEHVKHHGKYYGYAPYIREMNLWNAHANQVIVVGLLAQNKLIDDISIAYTHQNIKFVPIPKFHIKSFSGILKLLLALPAIVFKIATVMKHSDHLHFRCPSNVAALASLVQIFFPSKPKTVRYAGNWNPKSKQPIGYRFQKFIFSNSFLSRHTTLLVYGLWPNQKKQVRPFFTATFYEDEKEKLTVRNYNSDLKFLFLGSLVSGKQPLLAIQIVEGLNSIGFKCSLEIFGDGHLRKELEKYVEEHHLTHTVSFHGNQNKGVIKEALKISHFTILPSKSEGWPKAISEGMFFGTIPISTKISCLPWMLDKGNRGILISDNLEAAISEIKLAIETKDLNRMSELSQLWAQSYTIERQALEIKNILRL
jgi:glycosyltransferase involved in cell wall biosynthesis